MAAKVPDAANAKKRPIASSADAESTAFHARFSKNEQTAIQSAATIRGQSLAEFVIGSAYDCALETISAESVIRLPDRDSALFARALRDPRPVDDAVLARFLDLHGKR